MKPTPPEWVPIIKENAKTMWVRHPGDGRVIKVKKARVMAVRVMSVAPLTTSPAASPAANRAAMSMSSRR